MPLDSGRNGCPKFLIAKVLGTLQQGAVSLIQQKYIQQRRKAVEHCCSRVTTWPRSTTARTRQRARYSRGLPGIADAPRIRGDQTKCPAQAGWTGQLMAPHYGCSKNLRAQESDCPPCSRWTPTAPPRRGRSTVAGPSHKPNAAAPPSDDAAAVTVPGPCGG